MKGGSGTSVPGAARPASPAASRGVKQKWRAAAPMAAALAACHAAQGPWARLPAWVASASA